MKSVVIALAVAWLGSTALAEDRQSDAAKAHFAHGQSLYAAGRYAEARAEFLAGFDLSRRPAFMFNAAECSRLIGDKSEARAGYVRYLELDPNGAQATLAKQRLAELGAPREPPPPQSAQHAPPPTVDHVPAPATSPAPPPTVDLVHAPATPPTTLPTSAVTSASPRSPGQAKRVAGLVVATGGLGLAVTGLYFGARASSLANDVATACSRGCTWGDVRAKDADGRSDARLQWVLYGAGAAALVTGGALYWLGARERVPMSVAPMPGGGSLTWSGSW